MVSAGERIRRLYGGIQEIAAHGDSIENGIRTLKLHVPAVRGDNLIKTSCLDPSAKPFADSDRAKAQFVDREVRPFPHHHHPSFTEMHVRALS